MLFGNIGAINGEDLLHLEHDDSVVLLINWKEAAFFTVEWNDCIFVLSNFMILGNIGAINGACLLHFNYDDLVSIMIKILPSS